MRLMTEIFSSLVWVNCLNFSDSDSQNDFNFLQEFAVIKFKMLLGKHALAKGDDRPSRVHSKRMRHSILFSVVSVC